MNKLSRFLNSYFMILLVSAALTILIYGRVLGLPFLFDDPIHLRWVDGRPWWSVWIDIEEMQHYRPLVMSLWALSQKWLPHNPLPLQILALLTHAANAALCGLLAQRISRRDGAGLAAAALFVSYPFHYQALPSPGSLSKPLSALLVLLAVWCYWHGRVQSIKSALIAAVLLAMLAPFAYEAAITAGGLLLLTELALWRSQHIARPNRWAWAMPALGLPFLIAWLLVPSAHDGEAGFPGFEALWQSSIYFQQGLTWPMALLARPLMLWTGLSDGLATALVTYTALALLAVLYARQQRGWLLCYAAGWFALSMAVQWLLLPFRYIIDGPRMLYLGGAGFALLWSDLLCLRQTVRWRQALGILALLAAVVWGGNFARQRISLVKAVTAPLDEAVALAAQSPDGLTAFVNAPRWYGLDEGQTGFALGHEGYTVLPSYYSIGLSDYAWANTGERYEMRALVYPDIREQWRVNLGYGDEDNPHRLIEVLRRAAVVYALTYAPDALSWRELGGAELTNRAAPLACYVDGPCLLDIEPMLSENCLEVELLWRNRRPPAQSLTVFVHLYTPDGALAAQDDGAPFRGLLPFAQWAPHEEHYGIRYLSCELGDLTGWEVGVGLYNPENGERLMVFDRRRQLLPDDTYRVPLSP